jgi:error-prone DNA polymerase
VRFKIDPDTRSPIYEVERVPQPPRAARAFHPLHAELGVRTAFSGLAIPGGGTFRGETYAHAAQGWPGAGTPEEVVRRAALFGYDTIGIVDLSTLAGVVRAFSEGQEVGVRVVVGSELWLDEGPLWLHAEDRTGYANLCRILTEARRGLAKGEIAHSLQRVCRFSQGLWATVLPPFSEAALPPLASAFTHRLSLALYRHGTPDDDELMERVQALAQRHQLPLLATGRVFLVDRADKRFHDVLTCMRQGLRIASAGQRLLPNSESHLRHPHDLALRFSDFPQALERAQEVAGACTFSLGELRYAFPAEDMQGKTPQAELEARAWVGACRRYGVEKPEDLKDDVKAQIAHELTLIQDLDVAPYFLTVDDIVRIAREKGILCQGRGSAANSVICFCLGITAIDPVRMRLLFERFLSRERGEPPDIDVDFEHERREEVIQAVYEKWGRDHAAMVAEVVSFRGRSAIREVGKVFGLPEVTLGKLSKMMLRSSLADVNEARLHEYGLSPKDPRIERTLTFALRLQGHPRHLAIHVGGFILTRDDIATLAPFEPARMPGRTIVPWDKDDVDALGIFKMDVLGLGMLTCIRKALDFLRQHEGEDLELATIPAEDPAVYDALCKGDSLGVFQVESRAQMAMLPRLQPRTFYDLVVEVAIVRPGPIQGGMVHPYLRRRNGEEPVEYPHPDLIPILERTLGVPIFQEQVMKIAIVGAGYTPGQADQLRRDMAAWKKNGRLARHKNRLIQGFVQKGISQDYAERLYKQIQGFGEYGFPESHSASFAILVYASAWLKVHHPAIFAAALINSLPMGFYAPAQIVADAQRHGVQVRPVCVTRSFWDCTLERDEAEGPLCLRLGMRVIKGMPEEEGQKVVAIRERGGPYDDVSTLFARTGISLKGQRALSKAGALDGLVTHRRQALWQSMVKKPPLLKFAGDESMPPGLKLPNADEKMRLDIAHTGIAVDDHPMRLVRQWMRERKDPDIPSPIRTLMEKKHGTWASAAGLVIGRQRPGTASGTTFITLEDETGMANIIVWSRDFERWRKVAATSRFMWVGGTLERQNEALHLIAKKMRSLDEAWLSRLGLKSRDFR